MPISFDEQPNDPKPQKTAVIESPESKPKPKPIDERRLIAALRECFPDAPDDVSIFPRRVSEHTWRVNWYGDATIHYSRFVWVEETPDGLVIEDKTSLRNERHHLKDYA